MANTEDISLSQVCHEISGSMGCLLEKKKTREIKSV